MVPERLDGLTGHSSLAFFAGYLQGVIVAEGAISVEQWNRATQEAMAHQWRNNRRDEVKP